MSSNNTAPDANSVRTHKRLHRFGRRIWREFSRKTKIKELRQGSITKEYSPFSNESVRNLEIWFLTL